jgi:hypothetical protein
MGFRFGLPAKDIYRSMAPSATHRAPGSNSHANFTARETYLKLPLLTEPEQK